MIVITIVCDTDVKTEKNFKHGLGRSYRKIHWPIWPISNPDLGADCNRLSSYRVSTDKCIVFIIPNADYTCLDDSSANSTNVCPCLNPQYDQSIMTSSVTSTWDMICERRSLGSLAQSVLQLGILGGSLIYGQYQTGDHRWVGYFCLLSLSNQFFGMSLYVQNHQRGKTDLSL